ncbi:hypothetical protein BVX99_03575, partial [bacterium F16]
MRKVCICKTATLSAMGLTVDELWQGLMRRKSALQPVERFSTEKYVSVYAGTIDALNDCHGRMAEALLDLLLNDFGELPPNTRLIGATAKGGIDVLERYFQKNEGCPAVDSPVSVLRKLKNRLNLSEEAININAACASSTIAVAHGASLIANGLADSVLVVAFDILSEFVFSGFSALKGMSPTPSRPFDRERDGLSLGEGAGAILLTSTDMADTSGLHPKAYVAGWGCANDANHITAPAKDGFGLIKAVNEALAMAGLLPTDIGAINAHGTGTIYNDLMEITAACSVFGDTGKPMHSIKGAIGHTLGAAGAIEVAVAIKALEEQLIPPTTGLTTADPAGASMLSTAPQPFESRYILTSNSGFGGINGVLILETPGTDTLESEAHPPALSAHITGIGWVTPDGLGHLRQGARFSSGKGPLPELARKDVFPEPYKRFGRLDAFSKVGLSAITLAMRDAAQEEWTEKRPFGIVAATDYGCLKTDMEYFKTALPNHGQFASPNLFAYTLPNCFLGEAAIRFGLAGSNFVLNSTETVTSNALKVSLKELAMGTSGKLLCGYNNPELEHGPADRQVGGLFFVLETEADEMSYGQVSLEG